MSAGRAEEDEGRMGPQPVEQQERMLGNKHGAEGEHQNYITKIDGKHGRYIAKIGVDKIIADRYKLPHTGPSKIFHVVCTGRWRNLDVKATSESTVHVSRHTKFE